MSADLNYDEVLIFIRKDMFYPITPVKGVSLERQASDNAELNPGTLSVEDKDGNVLWRMQ